MKLSPRNLAQALHDGLRFSEKVFKLHAVLSLARDTLEKLDDVLVDSKSRLLRRVVVSNKSVRSERRSDRVWPPQRTESSRRMPEQMYVEAFSKSTSRAPSTDWSSA
jgi:hypothetical protein